MTPLSLDNASEDGLHASSTENEPFLAPLAVSSSPAENSTSDDRAPSTVDRTASRSHSDGHAHASHPTQRQVSVRLLRALSPQLSQWLQTAEPRRSVSRQSSHRDDSSTEYGGDNATASLHIESVDAIATRRLENGEPVEGSRAASRRRGASAASGRPPVTLRVLPVMAPRSLPPNGPVPVGSSPVDTIELNVNESELPPLLPLASSTQASQSPVDAEDGPPSRSASPRSTTSSDDVSVHEEQSTMDELHTVLRRCHHSLPFAALFLVYFAYQHATGIIVFIIGSVAIVGLDERLRKQVALKEDANRMYLVGMIAVALADAVAVSTIGGNVNPLRHLARRLEPPSPETENPSGALFVDVVWLVLVNDFILRLWSLAMKAVVALVRPEALACVAQRPVGISTTSVAIPAVDEDDLEMGSRRKLTRTNVSFYRRKRKLYGIIELSSIFVRSLFAGVPWCSYYQLCASKYVGNLFTFVYIFGKGIILATQGRQLLQIVRSFMTQGLEHASHVTRDEVESAGCPDCSICYETMESPVKLSCSHMFCEECVMEWFDRERSCPLCRAAIASTSNSQAELKPQYLDGSTSLFPQLF